MRRRRSRSTSRCTRTWREKYWRTLCVVAFSVSSSASSFRTTQLSPHSHSNGDELSRRQPNRPSLHSLQLQFNSKHSRRPAAAQLVALALDQHFALSNHFGELLGFPLQTDAAEPALAQLRRSTSRCRSRRSPTRCTRTLTSSSRCCPSCTTHCYTRQLTTTCSTSPLRRRLRSCSPRCSRTLTSKYFGRPFAAAVPLCTRTFDYNFPAVDSAARKARRLPTRCTSTRPTPSQRC